MCAIKILAAKRLVLEAVMVAKNDVYTEIPLVGKDRIALLQVVIMGFDIYCLEIAVFLV